MGLPEALFGPYCLSKNECITFGLRKAKEDVLRACGTRFESHDNSMGRKFVSPDASRSSIERTTGTIRRVMGVWGT